MSHLKKMQDDPDERTQGEQHGEIGDLSEKAEDECMHSAVDPDPCVSIDDTHGPYDYADRVNATDQSILLAEYHEIESVTSSRPFTRDGFAAADGHNALLLNYEHGTCTVKRGKRQHELRCDVAASPYAHTEDELVALILPRKDGDAELSPEIARLIDEYADVFPDDLPARLPPRRNVGHVIELEPGTRPI
ncbi:g11649 [Coccomyxa elongata]